MASSLRDFFIAKDRHGMESALAGLGQICPNSIPAGIDWQEVEFAFNRLFVGPASLEAPPYASAYLDPEGRVMGATTLEIRGVFAALGLESPWKNILPDDHLSLELDGAMALEHALMQSDAAEIAELRDGFSRHMQAWVPQFIERMKKAPSTHPVIIYAADCLSVWLDSQAEKHGHTTDSNI